MNVVIINCFDTYESRVDMLHSFFVKRGDSVEVYTSNFCHFQKCERTDDSKGYHLVKTRFYEKNLSLGRILSHMIFARDIRKIVEKLAADIDLLWVMLPPNSLAMQLSKIKDKYPKIKLIFDVIDVWPETMPVSGVEKLPPIQYWKNLRDRYLKNADLVVTECMLFQRKIVDKVSASKLTNLYFAKKASGILAVDESKNDRVELCYLGSINNIVDIEVIGKIITQLRKWKPVKLHIIGDGERRADLIEEAKTAGAVVDFHGIVYNENKKNEIFSQCHFGLNIMKESVCVGLTMKSMDYFEAGLPMINNIKGDTWDMIEKNGFGVNYPFDMEKVAEMCQGMEVRQKVRSYFEEQFSENAFDKALDAILKNV